MQEDDPILIIGSMKMEIPVVATERGSVLELLPQPELRTHVNSSAWASIHCSASATMASSRTSTQTHARPALTHPGWGLSADTGRLQRRQRRSCDLTSIYSSHS